MDGQHSLLCIIIPKLYFCLHACPPLYTPAFFFFTITYLSALVIFAAQENILFDAFFFFLDKWFSSPVLTVTGSAHFSAFCSTSKPTHKVLDNYLII